MLSSILGQLGSMFLNAGTKGLGNALFSGLGFADGGRPPVGQVSVVGERGPELFVPDTAGTVISNEASRAAMGRYSGSSSGGSSSKTIHFQSEVINNVEYVTVDQAMAMSRAAADDGAKRGAAGGHAKSMSTLQNSRSQRAKLGMR